MNDIVFFIKQEVHSIMKSSLFIEKLTVGYYVFTTYTLLVLTTVYIN